VWTVYFDVDLPGRKQPQMLGQCDVHLDGAGHPLEGPSLTLDKRVGIGGSQYRIDVEGVDSLTEFGLDEGIQAFTKAFGHPPTELPGTLADDNLAIFQKEYAAQIAKGASPDTAKQRAAAQTPFAKARGDGGKDGKRGKGYTQLQVDPSSKMVKIVVGHPPRVYEVPAGVKITARKP